MIQKQEQWVPYELKPRDIKQRLVTCEQLLQQQKRKSFLHCSMTGNESGYTTITLSVEDCGLSLAMHQHWWQSHGSKILLCIWWYQLTLVYYEWLKPTETIMGDRYQLQLMHLSQALKKKMMLYKQRHDKMILQHDNAWPHVVKQVKTSLETLKWEVLHCSSYSPDIAQSNYHLFQLMAYDLAEQHFHFYEDAKKWVDSWLASKDMLFFQCGI